MEGVGARLGRSSTRYGPATVFSGPVRKWKKRWIQVSPSNNNQNQHNNNNTATNNNNININGSNNGSSTNGNNGANLVLYKWTPLSQKDSNGTSNGNNNDDKNSVKDDSTPEEEDEEPRRRKFKYIPIAVLEEQKRIAESDAAESADDEVKPSDNDPSDVEPAVRSDGFDEKPDMNDVPMEENQEDEQVVRQDLNETLDLSLGLKAHDGDSDSNAG